MGRVAKRIGIVAAGVVGLALLLLALLVGALQVPSVRNDLLALALEQLNSGIAGELRVADSQLPRPSELELRGVTLVDSRGESVGRVARAVAHVDLGALLGGTVQIDRLDTEGVALRLGRLDRVDQDPGGLLGAFQSTTPAAQPPASGAAMGPRVNLERVCLEGKEITAGLSGQERYGLRSPHLCGAVRISPAGAVRIRLDALSGALLRNGVRVAWLGTPDGVPSGSGGGAGRRGSQAWLSLGGELVIAEDGLALDVRGDARRVSHGTLAALGASAGGLPLPLDAQIAAQGQLTDLSVRVDLSPLDGSRGQRLHGSIDAHVSLPEGEGPVELEAELAGVRLDGASLPSGQLAMTVAQDGGIRLERLRLREGEARVELSGELSADGDLRGTAQLEVPDLSELGILQGQQLDPQGGVVAEVALQSGSDGNLELNVEATLRGLQLADARARRLHVDARVTGALPRPRVRATIAADTLQLSGIELADAHLQVKTEGDRYLIEGTGDRRDLAIDVWVRRLAGGVLEGAGNARLRTPEGPLAARLAHARFEPGHALRVRQLLLRYHDASARASGFLALDRGRASVRVTAEIPQLSALVPDPPQVGGRPLPGSLRIDARVRGRLERPRVTTNVIYRGGPRFAGRRLSADLDLDADLQRGFYEAHAAVQGGEGAQVNLGVEARLRAGIPSAAGLRRGRYDLQLDVEQLSLTSLVEALPPGAVPLSRAVTGKLEAHVGLAGTLTDPVVDATVDSRLRFETDDDFTDLQAQANYETDRVVLAVKLTDRQGRLLDLEIDTDAQRDLFEGRFTSIDDYLQQSRWSVGLDIASRRLWNLPGIRAYGDERVLMPFEVRGKGELSHRPGREPEGFLDVHAGWLPLEQATTGNRDDVREDCVLDQKFVSDIKATMGDGLLTLRVESTADGKQIATVQGKTRAPLNRWLDLPNMAVGPAQLELELDSLRADAVPVLCEHASGILSARITGKDLFDRRASLRLSSHLENLSIEQGPRVNAQLGLRAEGGRTALDVEASQPGNSGRARIEGTLPISLRVQQPALCIDSEGEVAAQVELTRMAVQPLVAAAPGVGNASGHFDGNLDVAGTLEVPTVHGRLVLSQVSVTLPEIGQRFAGVTGEAFLEGRTLRLPKVRLRDRGGTAEVSAEVTMEDEGGISAEVDVETDDFPLRKQGIYVGQADAHAHAEIETTPELMAVRVEIRDLDVRLTGQSLEELQPLAPNPDVVFVRSDDQEAELVADVAGGQDKGRERDVVLGIRTTGPVWIRRDDFSLQASADLQVRPDDESAHVSGEIELRRGYLDLFGQTFDVEEGSIRFTGSDDVNPQLAITATADSASGSGRTRVEVSGFVSDPELAFFVNGEPTTAGEALAAMTGGFDSDGTADSSSAAEQLSSVATGMTAGLLTLGVRRNLGEWVPRLSIRQSGAETQIAAGIEADRVIPPFLRGFVRGAYVEGIVNTGVNEDGSAAGGSSAQGATAGVLLELLLPRDLVWAGEYGPGQRWSLDLDWRP